MLSRDTGDRLKALEDGFTAERDRSVTAHETAGSRTEALSGAVERLPGEIAAHIQLALTEQINGLLRCARGRCLAGRDGRNAHARRARPRQRGNAEQARRHREARTWPRSTTGSPRSRAISTHWRRRSKSRSRIWTSRSPTSRRASRSLELASERPVEMLEALHAGRRSHEHARDREILPAQSVLVLAVRHRRLARCKLAVAIGAHRARAFGAEVVDETLSLGFLIRPGRV